MYKPAVKICVESTTVLLLFFSALIKLLHETVASENSSDKMLEMVMKVGTGTL